MVHDVERLEQSHREVSEELLVARQRLAIIRRIIESPARLAQSPASAFGMIRLALNTEGSALAMLMREGERGDL